MGPRLGSKKLFFGEFFKQVTLEVCCRYRTWDPTNLIMRESVCSQLVGFNNINPFIPLSIYPFLPMASILCITF